MSPYRAALLALVVVGVALASVVPAGATSGLDAARHAPGGTHDALGGTESQADPVAGERASVGVQADANDSENDSALGADISSFMQSSVAETDGAVETGMWSAAFNGTENRSVRQRLVERRTDELRSELDELRSEKAELMAEREAGNVSETTYKARVSRLAGRMNALESSINATSSRARAVGTNVEELSTLRTETENLSGPAVAAVARNVSGVGNGNGNALGNVGNGTTGPPGDAGSGNGNGPDDAGNGPGDAGNGTAGPPSDRGNAPLADSAAAGVTSGAEAGAEAPGQRGNADTPGQNGVQGRDGAPGQNGTADRNETTGNDSAPGDDGPPGRENAPGHEPEALAPPIDVLDGSNVATPANGFDGDIVSTVRVAATLPW